MCKKRIPTPDETASHDRKRPSLWNHHLKNLNNPKSQMEDWFFAIECGSVFEPPLQRLCLSSAWVQPFSFQLSLGSYFLFNAHLSFRRNVFWSALWWLYFGGVDAQRRKLERNGFEVHLWLCWFCERSSHVFQTKRSDAKVNLANVCDEIREDKTAMRVRKCLRWRVWSEWPLDFTPS